MKNISSLIVFLLLITFGCQNSNPSESSKDDDKETLDSKETESTCLELSFIENLESSWESSYKDNSLPLKGFVRIQSGPVENGQEIVFENKLLKNQLKISKLKYGDVEESFHVEYLVQPKQLLCLEEQMKENKVVEKDDSLYALIIDFDKIDNQNAQISIRNNPQLKEINLYSPDQDFVNFLSSEKMGNLSYLIIKKFERESLFVPSFSKLKYFEINSDSLVLLDITQSDFNQLTTLNIEASRLLNCNVDSIYPLLDILNLHAPLLQFFPITNTPRLTALSWQCSFKEFPENLCRYNDLVYIAIRNYYRIHIDKCFKKKIKNGFDSHLTIYDRIDGEILKEIHSND